MMIEETIVTQAGHVLHYAVIIHLAIEVSKNKLVKETNTVLPPQVRLPVLEMPGTIGNLH